MEIKIKQSKDEYRISILDNRVEVGSLTFQVIDKRKALATHTIVSEHYQGQGIAARLVDALVEHCSEHGLLIEPVCGYVARISEREGKLAELLENFDRSAEIIAILESMKSPRKAEDLHRFFKTGPGEYGEGDVFLGIAVPDLRRLLKQLGALSTATLIGLWHSSYHEARSLGYYSLRQWAEQATSPESVEQIYQLYWAHVERCNNWDLVDNVAEVVIGYYWADRSPQERAKALDAMVRSSHLWTQRIGIVGTFALIRRGMYEDTFRLAEYLLDHEHDLIHKATGWMLREVGKRIDKKLLTDWLEVHATRMPRIALRYAIERLTPDERAYFLAKR